MFLCTVLCASEHIYISFLTSLICYCDSDPVFVDRKKAYYASKEGGQEMDENYMFNKLENYWHDLGSRLSNNELWIFAMLLRSNFDLPLPLVNAPLSIRQYEFSLTEAYPTAVSLEYDVKSLVQNLDFVQLGYLVKMVYMHFLSPLPTWIQQLHSTMFMKSANAARTRNTSAEGTIYQLENCEECPYTPEEFGLVLQDQVYEAFGKDTFNIRAANPKAGTPLDDNLRLYKSLVGQTFSDWGPANSNTTVQAVTQETNSKAKKVPENDYVENEEAKLFASRHRRNSGAGTLFQPTYNVLFRLSVIIFVFIASNSPAGGIQSTASGPVTPKAVTGN